MARHERGLWPLTPPRSGRFGPPTEHANGTYWIYGARTVQVAAWESQTCVSDAKRPWSFSFCSYVEEMLIAKMTFSQPLRLFDLTGTAATYAGVYDVLRSPDHDWCRWFGVLMQELISESAGSVHGFMYPSRRCPGSYAIALSSTFRDLLNCWRETAITRFIHSDEYMELQAIPTFRAVLA